MPSNARGRPRFWHWSAATTTCARASTRSTPPPSWRSSHALMGLVVWDWPACKASDIDLHTRGLAACFKRTCICRSM
eukprot:9218811-Lingulodinium_polyedra.AAC.1